MECQIPAIQQELLLQGQTMEVYTIMMQQEWLKEIVIVLCLRRTNMLEL